MAKKLSKHKHKYKCKHNFGKSNRKITSHKKHKSNNHKYKHKNYHFGNDYDNITNNNKLLNIKDNFIKFLKDKLINIYSSDHNVVHHNIQFHLLEADRQNMFNINLKFKFNNNIICITFNNKNNIFIYIINKNIDNYNDYYTILSITAQYIMISYYGYKHSHNIDFLNDIYVILNDAFLYNYYINVIKINDDVLSYNQNHLELKQLENNNMRPDQERSINANDYYYGLVVDNDLSNIHHLHRNDLIRLINDYGKACNFFSSNKTKKDIECILTKIKNKLNIEGDIQLAIPFHLHNITPNNNILKPHKGSVTGHALKSFTNYIKGKKTNIKKQNINNEQEYVNDKHIENQLSNYNVDKSQQDFDYDIL